MPITTGRLRCVIVTPQTPVLDADALDVVFPAHDGLIGILPGHAPLLCRLGAGVLRYRNNVNKLRYIYVENGFCRVLDDTVSILARRVIAADDISVGQAEEKLIRARSMPTATIEQAAAHAETIRRAKEIITLAKTEKDV